MNRTALRNAGLVGGAVAILVAVITSSSSRPRPAPPDAQLAPAATARRPAISGDRVRRSRYQLQYAQRATAGSAEFEVVAAGTWIETARRDGRVDVRFEPAEVEGPDMPPPPELEVTAQLVMTDGVVGAMGFSERTTSRSKRLLTALATTFQLASRRGDRWTADEEDLMGRYRATYQAAGGGLLRTRPRYLAARGAAGLSTGDASALTPTEHTRFTVDGDGVVTAAVELTVEFRISPEAQPSTMQLTAALSRASVEYIADPDGPALAAAPISGHADLDPAGRNADESFVAGASFEELLALAQRAIARGPEGSNDRAQALARIASLVRLEPDVAAEIAAWVLAHQEDNEAVQLVTGALSSTGIAAGTNALASLSNAELTAAARDRVVAALALSAPATTESLAALTRRLGDPDAVNAPIGLGIHARHLQASDPAAADAATDLLIQRHGAAREREEQIRYLHALGNSGSPRITATLGGVIDRGDAETAGTAAYALRLIPGAEADALLERALDRPELAIAAVRAIAHRDRARWAARLDEITARYAGNNVIQGELRQIRRAWSRPAPEPI